MVLPRSDYEWVSHQGKHRATRDRCGTGWNGEKGPLGNAWERGHLKHLYTMWRMCPKKPPCNVDVSLLEDFGLALQMKLQQICVETAQGTSCEHRQRKASSVSGVVRALTGWALGTRAASLTPVRKSRILQWCTPGKSGYGASGLQACGKRSTAKLQPYGSQMSLKWCGRQTPTVNA